MKIRLLHIGIHESKNENAGDTVLFDTVRALMDHHLGPCEWSKRQLWEEISAEDINSINQETDGIVIGGGGLLLRDQVGSSTDLSGWQWNISVENIKKIDVPVAVFAIGYNRFRNQKEFNPKFSENINALVAKSGFFGLRNNGSIGRMADYVSPQNHKKIVRQMCPTTVLKSFNRNYMASQLFGTPPLLAINVAFDRQSLRFKGNIKAQIEKLLQCAHIASTAGWSLAFVAHKHDDLKVLDYIDKQNLKFDIKNLTSCSTEEIIGYYKTVDLSIGMRGHSQMIPFGLGVPIFSAITHDKMRYFLEDIGEPDWGEELSSKDFVSVFTSFFDALHKSPSNVYSRLDTCQKKIWTETQNNMVRISEIFSAKG